MGSIEEYISALENARAEHKTVLDTMAETKSICLELEQIAKEILQEVEEIKKKRN